jgi:glyoxylase-like metal-dependent hydrolase (beta-lactamase superfamily II)
VATVPDLPALSAFLHRVASRARALKSQQSRYFTQRSLKDTEFTLAVAKHWNSETPIVPAVVRPTERLQRLPGYGLGGGYFLAAHGHGIAIDPGYQFTQMLFSEYGYTILDIDAVIVTHDHPDHWADLPNLTLLRHLAHRQAGGGGPAPLEVYFDPSSAKALTGLLPPHQRSHVVRPGDEVPLEVAGRRAGVTVRFLRAFHSERLPSPGTHGHAMGLSLQVDAGPDDPHGVHVVITGDTQCPPRPDARRPDAVRQFSREDLAEWDRQYPRAEGIRRPIDVLCLHMGSVEQGCANDSFALDSPQAAQDLQYDGFHLGFGGALRLLDTLFPGQPRPDTLAILTEFGEELRGARTEMARWLGAAAQANRGNGSRPPLPVLPADLGFLLDLRTRRVLCTKCRANRVCAVRDCPMDERECGHLVAHRQRTEAPDDGGREIDLAWWFGRANPDLFHAATQIQCHEDNLEELIHYSCAFTESPGPLRCGACEEGQRRCRSGTGCPSGPR